MRIFKVAKHLKAGFGGQTILLFSNRFITRGLAKLLNISKKFSVDKESYCFSNRFIARGLAKFAKHFEEALGGHKILLFSNRFIARELKSR